FTDGRSHDDLSGLAAAHPRVAASVVDCERGTVRLGRARGVALHLAAGYIHVEQLWADAATAAPPRASLPGAGP
ncbi:MAG TPA: hypothetical protein VMG12_27175, partial [Polyangiaceae bacterium]|nr:hypothetical protein [Polyangiaceae bacterium]